MMMNKTCCILLCILFMFFTLGTSKVYADDNATKIQMHTSDTIKNNRGFNIYFGVKSESFSNLGAFRLKISYDDAHFSFMEAKLCNLDANMHYLKANAKDGVVTVLFAGHSGIPLTENIQDIFYLRFKAVDTKNQNQYIFEASVMEVVDFDGNYISYSNIQPLTINGSSSSTSSASENNSSTVSEKLEGLEDSSVIREGETIILQDKSEINLKENMFPVFLLFIVFGILVFVIAFYLGRKQRKKIISSGEYKIEDGQQKRKKKQN